MDHNRNIDNFPHCSLLLLSFFEQKGCQNSVLRRELDDFDFSYDHNYNDSDGDLQTDGHSSVTYKDLLHELQNQVQPQLPGIFTVILLFSLILFVLFSDYLN